MYEPLTLFVEAQNKAREPVTKRSKILFGPTEDGNYAQNEHAVHLTAETSGGGVLWLAFYDAENEEVFSTKLNDLYFLGGGDHFILGERDITIHINVMRDMVKGLWKRVQTSVPTRESMARKDIFEGGHMRFHCTLCSKPIQDIAVIAGGKNTLVGGRGLPEWRYCSWACRLADDTPEKDVNALKFKLLWEGKMV